MRRRPGVTLVEVLVSIFVAAVGLLGLLALFPVGAFSMAAALKNGRCVQASINAKALASMRQIWQDPSLTSPLDLFTSPSLLPVNLPALPPNSNYVGPSYPIYIDPVGASLTSYLGYNAF